MSAAPSPRHTAAAVVSDIAATGVAILTFGLVGSAPHGQVLAVGPAVLAMTAGAMALSRVWDPTVLGNGSTEFGRLVRAFFGVAGAVSVLALAYGWLNARPWVFGVLPLAAGLVVLGRLWLRRDLHRWRMAGGGMSRVLAVGTVESAAELIRRTRQAPRQGWLVEGVCTPTGAGQDGSSYIADVHVVGDLDAVAALTRRGQYDIVAISPVPGWTNHRLRLLAAELAGTSTELVVEPAMVDVPEPRRADLAGRLIRGVIALAWVPRRPTRSAVTSGSRPHAR